MLTILYSLLVGALCSSIVSADAEAGTLRFNFEKKRVPSSSDDLVRRQSGTVLSAITNEQLLYLINITVGTPPQQIGLQLDTGSSDTWFAAYDSDVCEAGAEYCELGSFNYNESSTFVDLQSDGVFSIEYVDGSQIEGVYMSDVVGIGNTQLTNVTLALALSADRGVGIMGVGFQSDESSAQRLRNPFTYPNIVEVLKNQGHISSLSYSLWLDDLNADTGSILFGGVDRTKYTGPLISLPIQNDVQSGQKTSFTVTWSNLTLTNSGQSVSLTPSSPQPAILDSGTTLTYLPDALANSIFSALGVTTNPQIGEVAPCSLAANNVTFTFTFGGSGGAVIKIPVSELLIPLINDNGTPYTGGRNGGGEPLCQFGIEAAGNNPVLFGDTFLRSAYVVYDLENLQVGLAQLNIHASATGGSSSVQLIPTAPASIPGVVSTASAVTVDQTFTGNPLITVASSGRSSSGRDSTISRSATLSLTASGTSAFTATAQTTSQSQSGSGGTSASTTARSSSSGSQSAASGSASSASASAGAAGMRIKAMEGGMVFGLGACAVVAVAAFFAIAL